MTMMNRYFKIKQLLLALARGLGRWPQLEIALAAMLTISATSAVL
jgi:hypothetical protein